MLASLLIAVNCLHAAEISVTPAGSDRPAVLTIRGNLARGDGNEFQKRAGFLSRALVVLSSNGGDLVSGIQIGETIRLKNFATVVPANAVCASACALAWLGGTTRFMGADSRIGFHSAYNASSGRETGVGNALLGAYLNKIGLPYSAVIYITKAAPDAMTWLSISSAKQIGIDVKLLTNDEQSRPDAHTGMVEHGSMGGLEARAQEFVTTVLVRSAESKDAVLTWFASRYAEVVDYYGKQTPRVAVLDDKARFLERWSERKYTVRPGSLSVACEQKSMVCNVEGIMDWQVSSKDGASEGTARFLYTLIVSPNAISIVGENGPVISPTRLAKSGQSPTTTTSAKPAYRLDPDQKQVREIFNLNTDRNCDPAKLDGRVVRRQLDEKAGTLVTGVTIRESDGRLTSANVEVPEDIDMATRGRIHDGLQTLLKEGNDVSLGVRLCGAAGRQLVVESVRAAR